MTNELRDTIKNLFESQELYFDEPMKGHTSFKIGGPATLFFVPSTVDHLKTMIDLCRAEQIPFYIMGNGSNLLVGDKGYQGVVIQVFKNLSQWSIEGDLIEAEAGILLSKLANRIYDAGLTGFEFASGIPGTLGGAVYMNAGAYGGEMKDVLISATVLSRRGQIREVLNADLDLGYRHSVLMAQGDIVLSAKMRLDQGEPAEIRALMVELNQRRKDKQPVEKPSAGSTFKRPVGHYAGKLIMDAGLRGYQIGGARVSDKHCGFVINTGDATGEDVLALIKHIQMEVKNQFGVDLEPEVRMIGEF